MKFPAFLVQVWFWCPPLTTTSNFDKKISKSRSAKQLKKKNLVDLSISWNFLYFWFRWDFWPPPPPPQTLTNNFLSPCIFGSGVIFEPTLPTTTSNFDKKISKSQLAKQFKKNILVDLYISWNFLHFWFRCHFWYPHPPPPPQTLTKKFYKSRSAKQWKNYFSWFIHIMKFPTFLVQVWFFTPCTPHHHLKVWHQSAK